MRSNRFLTAILLAFAVASCTPDSIVQYDWTDVTDPGEDAAEPGDDVWNPGWDTIWPEWKEQGGDEDGRYEIIILDDTTAPLQLMVGEHRSITAKVLDYKLQKPAAFYPVIYEVITSEPMCEADSCGAFLVKEGMTNEDGIVQVTFEAGEVPDVLYDVELSGKNATGDGWQINVNPIPTGTVRVNLAYEGPVPIHAINVRLMHGSFSCQQFNPVYPWIDELDGQKTVPGIGSSVTWEGLSLGETYLVFATAMGPSEHLTAKGCVDAVHLIPALDGITDVTLELNIVTLNPAGTYDATSTFDFTGAIPGQVGDIINLVVSLFYDPGAFIIDMVKTLVSQYIGSWVTDLAFSLFEDALGDLITDWLLNNSPGFIQDFFVIGQDLVQIVKSLTLTSELKISKLSSDYYIQGIQSWQGVILYWKLGCPKEGEPDYDPECGAIPFGLQDLEDSDVPMDLITGQFTGMIANFDNLIIDTHYIYLNYGKLILFVINEVLLPAVSGYNSIEDLIYSIIDCEGIASGFVGSILSAIGIDEDDVEGFCLSAVGLIVSPIEEVIGSLKMDSQLRIHGKCVMLDDNDDLYVDFLINGLWWGHVEIQSEEGAEFEGVWDAVKADYPGN
jgi:hypothetical protein